MRTLVIDPTSTELNRGSFCYLSYIFYSYLENTFGDTMDIELWEDFTINSLDKIQKNDKVYVALWSYPQIDLCKVLYRFCPSRRISFFGYEPLIKELNLPFTKMSDHEMKIGLNAYPYRLLDSNFKQILLSDCDMHLKKYEGKVYPLFTSYGCPRSCKFCPSAVNCNHKRLELSVNTVNSMIHFLWGNDILNIHFTDEDFFFDPDRAYEILDYAKSLGRMNFIVLAHLDSLEKYIEEYGASGLYGVKLVELGFETADPSLAKEMHKKHSLERYINLYEKVKGWTNIFWLCMTFFPGETISTLNATGEFLEQYGSKPDDLYSRIVTNSTEGGLGQFFQPYPGTPGYDKLPSLGEQIEDRPVRLIPSFLPNSFLDDQISLVLPSIVDLEKLDFWCKIYNLPITHQDIGCLHERQVRWGIAEIMDQNRCSIGEAATFLAILARLRIIRSAK